MAIYQIKNKLFLLVSLLVLFSSIGSVAQKLVTIEEAIELSIKNNPSVLLADQRIAQEKALLPSTVNVNNLDVLFQSPTGQDQRPSILQTIAFPTVYVNQYRAQNVLVDVAGIERSISINNLKYNVKINYNNVQFLIEKEKMLTKFDSTLVNLLKVNEVRYNVGQIANLEKINGEAKYKTLQNQLLQTRAELNSVKFLLSNLISGKPEGEVFLPVSNLQKSSYSLSQDFQLSFVDKNPFNSLFERKRDYANRLLRTEQHRTLPSIMFGYFSQVTPDPALYYRLQFGVSLPLWYWKYNSLITAAKRGVESANTQIAINKNRLTTEYASALSQYNQFRESLNYFENTGLKQSAEILRASEQSFRAGSINYYVYLYNLDQAFQIQLLYLDALKSYNQSIINLNYLQGDI